MIKITKLIIDGKEFFLKEPYEEAKFVENIEKIINSKDKWIKFEEKNNRRCLINLAQVQSIRWTLQEMD